VTPMRILCVSAPRMFAKIDKTLITFNQYNAIITILTCRKESESISAPKRSMRYVRAERSPHFPFLFRASTECKDTTHCIDPQYQLRDKAVKGIPVSSTKRLAL
jgi:hypothetical protein